MESYGCWYKKSVWSGLLLGWNCSPSARVPHKGPNLDTPQHTTAKNNGWLPQWGDKTSVDCCIHWRSEVIVGSIGSSVPSVQGPFIASFQLSVIDVHPQAPRGVHLHPDGDGDCWLPAILEVDHKHFGLCVIKLTSGAALTGCYWLGAITWDRKLVIDI